MATMAPTATTSGALPALVPHRVTYRRAWQLGMRVISGTRCGVQCESTWGGAGVELAHRGGVAGGEVGEVRVAAHIIGVAPGAGAAPAGSLPGHDADAGHVGQGEGTFGSLALDDLDTRRDADLGEVDALERRQQLV